MIDLFSRQTNDHIDLTDYFLMIAAHHCSLQMVNLQDWLQILILSESQAIVKWP